MHALIADLQSSADLSADQVEQAVAQLVSPDITDGHKADFLKALRTKGESAAEIASFARSMLARAVNPGIDPARIRGPMLDVCGTGGDKLELFNVSTAAMFVLAAGGVTVVKHGNRAITSKCGGADVLEELGVILDLPPEKLRACVEQHGLGFVFAPAYHPAFKAIIPVRRALAAEGVPTVFNLLGPLLNPARPAYQLVGIFSPILLPKYAEALTVLGRARAWAVHGSGMDELSLCGSTEVREILNGSVNEFRVDPRDIGLRFCAIEDLRGGDRKTNARILLDILEGADRGPRRDLVLLNAAAGFVITGIAPNLAAAYDLAREQITSGRARAKLNALRRAGEG
jgi:anthranilate phosphoribosyltransferase